MKSKTIPFFFIFFFSWQINAETKCVAHRALGYGGLENSLEAISQNVDQESWGLEIDIRHTRDGKTLVYHDTRLNRLVRGDQCPKKSKVSRLNFNEIIENCELANREKIPSLREALERLSFGNTKLFLEIKDNKITHQDYLDIFEFFSNRPEQIYFISFHKEVLEKIYQDSQLNAFLSKTKILLLKSNGNRLNLDRLHGIDTKKIGNKQVKKYQADGKLVGVYTKNHRSEIEEFIEKGVDFITTDKIPLCRSLTI
ncbi:MAG: glycerophosphodiester phosphodiesterase family protein [Bdellovibrionota bacterium]|nr:glycerophosphodiester phosphodiesterase family protein [Bdellovibrionota bacterium]